jgi:hypothetical protein
LKQVQSPIRSTTALKEPVKKLTETCLSDISVFWCR